MNLSTSKRPPEINVSLSLHFLRMRLFVTGGTGFIGSHFLNAALAAGHQVRALRRSGSEPRIALERQPEWIEGGLDDVSPDMLRDNDAIVHLAAAGVDPATSGWDVCFRHNVQDFLSLLLCARSSGIRDFLVCGSCFEYGRSGERYEFIPIDAPLEPTGPYHASKAAATMAAIAFASSEQARVRVLRPFHVFGEGEAENRLWPLLRKAASEGRDFPMTAGAQIRDFVPVGALASAFVDALDFTDLVSGESEIRNLGTGRPTSLLDFCQHWWVAFGATGRLLPGEIPYRDQEVMRYVPFV